jgi:hypothetical protein
MNRKKHQMTVTTMPDPQHRPEDCRLSHEPPAAIAKRGWRFHHIGVPTDIQHPGETHLAEYGLYVAGFSTSPYGVEWMRFEKSSPLPEFIKISRIQRCRVKLAVSV